MLLSKTYYLLHRLLVVQFLCGSISSYCPDAALVRLPFVLEYAVWRGWRQTMIYTPDMENGCEWATVRLAKCLNINGIASGSNSLENIHARDKLGVVILAPRLKRNATKNLIELVKKLHKLQMDTSSFDWLVAARSNQDFRFINEILNATSIRFDQNIVVTYTYIKPGFKKTLVGLCDSNFIYKSSNEFMSRRRYLTNNRYKFTRNQSISEYERNYYRTTERFRNLTNNNMYKKQGSILPLFQSGVLTYNYSRTFDMTNISRFSIDQYFKQRNNRSRSQLKTDDDTDIKISVVQYFKVRSNSTLFAHFLGIWDRVQSMSRLDVPYPVEARNFLGEELIVGRCNSSGEGSPSLDDDGPSAEPMLDDILRFLSVRLNTTSITRFYGALGFRTYEGSWTGLLGALMDHSVDVALEPVTVHASRSQDMQFIFPIAETMCNIYIRQQETSTVRDIFLAPFSARLVACVVAVAVVASITIVLISRTTVCVNARRMGYTEGLIWSTGILCQQGGSWTPTNPAASVLLIVCLFFAVVTYNAYAAFITSVLSVRVASVDTIAAVLHSPNFKIGYIRNGADQMYLMSTKDVQLNAFYIRGYSDADNLVSSAQEGLARAARQDYAFFAGQRVARSTLRSLSQARGRCAVRELPVHSTRAHLAFPLPRNSPYARPTLVTLLQLRSGGALARLEAALVPDMPQCAPPPGFASARASDVRSALILLSLGLIFSMILGLGEYCWKNRKELRDFIVNCYRRLLHKIVE